MKNLVLGVGFLTIILIAIFLFSHNESGNNDIIIPTPLSVATPSPNVENLSLNSDQGKNMQLPFQILNRDEISGKRIEIQTDLGNIEIELFPDSPIASSNFISLVNKKFYDGLIFHRVIKGFMIQGGDPNGNGTGGPGYKFPDEAVKLPYTRGIVAMANAGPDTNGSQFFIMHQDYNLPPSYTIFGKVTSGIEVVDKIANSQVGPNDKPIKDIKIISATFQ